MTNLDNKVKIVKAMASLMNGRSLATIRTVDICKEAGVSRQTFYRCFEDKFDAAIWFVEQGIRSSVREVGVTLSWATGFKRLFQFSRRNRSFILRIFSMGGVAVSEGDPEIKKRLESNCARHFEEQYLTCCAVEPDRLIKFQIQSFSKTLIRFMNDFLQDDVRVSEELIEFTVTLVPRELYRSMSIPDQDVTDLRLEYWTALTTSG